MEDKRSYFYYSVRRSVSADNFIMLIVFCLTVKSIKFVDKDWKFTGVNLAENRIHLPETTRRAPTVGLILGQRRRPWANIMPTVGECLMFAGVLALPEWQTPERRPNVGLMLVQTVTSDRIVIFIS